MDYEPEMDYGQRPAPSREDRDGKGSGRGGLWLLLAPLACCGGPLIVGALAAAGAPAWGALGLGLALATAVPLVLVVRRRRRCRGCCPPVPAGSARPAGPAAGKLPAR